MRRILLNIPFVVPVVAETKRRVGGTASNVEPDGTEQVNPNRMKNVLIIGMNPATIDLSSPEVPKWFECRAD